MPGRVFRLYDVLAVTHHLPSVGSDYQAILEYLSGEPIPAPTHALRVADECRTWLLEQHPELCDVPPCPDFQSDEAAMDAWCAEQALRVGETMTLDPLPLDRRDFRSHMESLLEHVDPQDVDVLSPEKVEDVVMGE